MIYTAGADGVHPVRRSLSRILYIGLAAAASADRISSDAVRMLNRELGAVFKRWYPDLEVEELTEVA